MTYMTQSLLCGKSAGPQESSVGVPSFSVFFCVVAILIVNALCLSIDTVLTWH